MWTYVLLLLLFVVFGSAYIIGPSNTAVVVGQKMEMKCQVGTNGTFRYWSIQRNSTSTFDQLVINFSNRSRTINTHYGVTFDDFGSTVLYVNSTTLDDAGIYLCAVEQEMNEILKYCAHLIVFETNPQCSSNSTLPLSTIIQEEIYVWMLCTVNFRGYLVPDIEWRRHEGHGKEYEEDRKKTNLVDTVIIPNSSITSEVIVVIASNTNRLFYSFEICFKTMNKTQLTNTNNAPNYTYMWTIHVVNISSTQTHFAPTTILTSVAVSLFTVLSVVAVIGCFCLKRHSSGSATRLTNTPDVATSQGGAHSDHFYSEDVSTSQGGGHSDPLYSEVLDIERTSVNSKQGTSWLGPYDIMSQSHDFQISQQLQYFGADGTEYKEVNSSNRQPLPARQTSEPNIFTVEEYACIDHTLLSQPIPPRGRFC